MDDVAAVALIALAVVAVFGIGGLALIAISSSVIERRERFAEIAEEVQDVKNASIVNPDASEPIDVASTHYPGDDADTESGPISAMDIINRVRNESAATGQTHAQRGKHQDARER